MVRSQAELHVIGQNPMTMVVSQICGTCGRRSSRRDRKIVSPGERRHAAENCLPPLQPGSGQRLQMYISAEGASVPYPTIQLKTTLLYDSVRTMQYLPAPLGDEQLRAIIGPLNADSPLATTEQRVHPRFAIHAKAMYQEFDVGMSPISGPAKGIVLNISQGGMLLDTGSVCDAPILRVQVIEDAETLADVWLRILRRGAGIVAGRFVMPPAHSASR